MAIVYADVEGLKEFDAAFSHAHQMVGVLTGSEGATMTHAEAEEYIRKQGNEFLRRLLQGYLNHRSAQEVREPEVSGSDNVARRSRRSRNRELGSIFGVVTVTRRAYEREGCESLHPLDASLNLPPSKYSHGLEQLVAKELAKGSTDATVELIDRMTGGHVPKRQILEAAIRVSQDFEAFYRQGLRSYPEASVDNILVLSTDGKGIVMRKEWLRETTRKAAQREQHKKVTRLSKGEKKNRKRMATVASVYSIQPHPRDPEDMLIHLDDEPRIPRPRPENKRIWASVERTGDQIIDEMFAEALSRDPEQRRPWVILVDGEPHQLRRIKRVLKQQKLSTTIIVDFIHVLEYLWNAAYGFFDNDDERVEEWVLERAVAVLKGNASQVAAGIRRSATLQGLLSKQRKPIDKCASYLLKYKDMLRYDHYLASGFPIATGVIEGACRHLINDRLDITGARWSLPGAEAVLKLRSLNSSGNFDAYFKFYQVQEYDRNYVSKFQQTLEHAA
jgi:hypothetical protein